MSTEVKNRLIGIVTSFFVMTLSFLTYSYFGSFETKADAISEHQKIRQEFLVEKLENKGKLDLVLCYMDDKHCTKELLIIKKGR